MMWVKCRSNANDWAVYHKGVANTEYMLVNSTAGKATGTAYWNSTTPGVTTFTVGTDTDVNTNTYTYVAYLFGDTPGLCKSFSYTGNGTNQDINLGFAPRFVILKRTDAAGDWRVFDSTRGVVAGNDPVLCLNTAAAEVTNTDPIDPISSGFNITQETTNNLNVNAATYIGWASA